MAPFVSYAQNFEDVMLWRALRHVEGGFYIDAGAAEPEADSVTAAFYQRGWRGLNIEPAPGPFGRLASARLRDVNVNVALGAVPGEQDFLVVDGGNGLSTLCADRRAALDAEGWDIETRRVEVCRLADLCQAHVTGAVHFLKIDVEGAERAVLEGAELQTWRPWIIVVEATRPRSAEPSFDEWEDLLLGARYRHVYADGLNRFYLAEEHLELAAAFAAPPNVFDSFIRAEEHRAKQNAAILHNQVGELSARLAEEHTALLKAAAERDAATQEMWESNRLASFLTVQRQQVQHQLVVERIAAQQAAEQAQAQLTAAREEAAARAAAALEEAEARLLAERTAAAAETRLAAVYQSTSWRIAAPVRALARLTRGQ